MWVQVPDILADGLFADEDELVPEPVLDELAAVFAVRLTRLAAAGLARLLSLATAWCAATVSWAAVAAPAELTPRPIPVPTTAALIAMATSALRLVCDMWVSFVLS